MPTATFISTPSKVHYSQYLKTENEQSEEKAEPSTPVNPPAPEAK